MSSKEFLNFILPLSASAISIEVSNRTSASQRAVKRGGSFESAAASQDAAVTTRSSSHQGEALLSIRFWNFVSVPESLTESGLLIFLVARELKDNMCCLKAVGD